MQRCCCQLLTNNDCDSEKKNSYCWCFMSSLKLTQESFVRGLNLCRIEIWKANNILVCVCVKIQEMFWKNEVLSFAMKFFMRDWSTEQVPYKDISSFDHFMIHLYDTCVIFCFLDSNIQLRSNLKYFDVFRNGFSHLPFTITIPCFHTDLIFVFEFDEHSMNWS